MAEIRPLFSAVKKEEKKMDSPANRKVEGVEAENVDCQLHRLRGVAGIGQQDEPCQQLRRYKHNKRNVILFCTYIK